MKKKIFVLTLLSAASVATVGTAATFSASQFGARLDAGACTHNEVGHHDAVAPTINRAGNIEYWTCCACHASFSDSALTNMIENTSGLPTDPGDGRYAAPLGLELDWNIVDGGSVSSEASPSSLYSKVYEKAGTMNLFYSDKFDISGYEQISFIAKSTGIWYTLRGGWTANYYTSWSEFKLVQTGDKVWSIYSANLGGEFALKYSSISGSTLREVLGFTGDSDTYYTTNLRVIKKDIAVPSTRLVAHSSVDPYTNVEAFAAPSGFTTVTKGTKTYGESDQGHTFLADIDISGYTEVSFAFMPHNRDFYGKGWSGCMNKDRWYKVVITNNLDGTYSSLVYNMEGTQKAEYSDVASFKASLLYYNGGGDYEMEWYSTEVRGTSMPLVGTVIDNCVLSANDAPTKESSAIVPARYENVRDVSGRNLVSSLFYSAQDLRAYSEVHFGYKQNGYFLFKSDWSALTASTEWFFFSLTQNEDTTWNLSVASGDGTSLYSAENISATTSDTNPQYTNYSLNVILNGMSASEKSGTPLFVTVTELRGTLK